jgi:hypothetical protein
MATKQLNELSSLTEAAADDYVAVYDSSETGSEKLKKYPVQSLKTDLTSMDPSAFGNWVRVNEVQSDTFHSVYSNPYITDVANEEYIKISVVLESVASTSIIMVAVGDADGWANSSSDYDGTVSGRQIISSFNASGKAIIDIIYEPKTEIFTITGTYHNGSSISNINVSISYKGTKTPTQIMFSSWNSDVIYITGEASVYTWQEIKPIELHSYELVKEYNLNNETLSDTFDWDGEADPEMIVITSLGSSTGVAELKIRPNNDSGNNYGYGGYGQDGNTLTASNGSGLNAFVTGTTGTVKFYSKFELYLKNDGKSRVGRRSDIHYDSTNTDSNLGAYSFWWNNTTDDVTTVNFSTAIAVSGNIRVYKLAKTHLFNQTIYNDTTLNVATTGSDTTGDGTSQKPFASINGALDWLKNKTGNSDITITIQVADGTYNNQTVSIPTNMNYNLAIVGNNTTPANVTLNFVSGSGGITVKRNTYVSISGLKLVGYDPDQWLAGISVQWGSAVHFYYCIVDNFGAGCQAYHGGHLNIDTSTINACQYGVHCVRHATLHIEDSTLSNNTAAALVAEQLGRVGYRDCTLTSNAQTTYTADGGTVTSF